jgi:hypothetical protein
LAAHKVTAKADHEFQELRLGICITELLDDAGHSERIPALISRPSHSARDPRDVEVKPYILNPARAFSDSWLPHRAEPADVVHGCELGVAHSENTVTVVNFTVAA